MRINMNIGMENNILNIRNNNQDLIDKKASIKDINPQSKEDSIFISPLGKAKSLIQLLMKQKQKIYESKDELITKTLEEGKDIESIELQLKHFEEQLKNIDEQIAQTMSEEIAKALEENPKQKNENLKNMIYEKPKTEEEIQNERLNSIVNLSSNLNQAQAVSSIKTKLDGESRVLEIEIKIDESRGGASTYKKERLDKLQKQSKDLNDRINKELVELNKEIKDNNYYHEKNEGIKDNGDYQDETESYEITNF